MRSFCIDTIPIDPPVALAPMEGVTDRAFRGVIRSLGGVGLTVTEFVSSEALTRDVENAWRMAELDPGEHPVSIQIYGRDPDRMAQAARHCEALGADIVDINLGCPSKRVTSGCAGSALMREGALAHEIFDAVHGAISVPMTVKMRLGWDHDQYTAPEIAADAVKVGAKMIAVHGRTKSDGYKNDSLWHEVRHVVDAVDVPVLVNGDIVDPASARAALEASGAAGVMVGRGVMADPWCLARISADLRGEPFVEPTLADRERLLFAYVDDLARDGNGRRTLGKLKRVMGYFSKGLWGAGQLRRSLNSVREVSAARLLLRDFFAEARAREADQRTLTAALAAHDEGAVA